MNNRAENWLDFVNTLGINTDQGDNIITLGLVSRSCVAMMFKKFDGPHSKITEMLQKRIPGF